MSRQSEKGNTMDWPYGDSISFTEWYEGNEDWYEGQEDSDNTPDHNGPNRGIR